MTHPGGPTLQKAMEELVLLQDLPLGPDLHPEHQQVHRQWLLVQRVSPAWACYCQHYLLQHLGWDCRLQVHLPMLHLLADLPEQQTSLSVILGAHSYPQRAKTG